MQGMMAIFVPPLLQFTWYWRTRELELAVRQRKQKFELLESSLISLSLGLFDLVLQVISQYYWQKMNDVYNFIISTLFCELITIVKLRINF